MGIMRYVVYYPVSHGLSSCADATLRPSLYVTEIPSIHSAPSVSPKPSRCSLSYITFPPWHEVNRGNGLPGLVDACISRRQRVDDNELDGDDQSDGLTRLSHFTTLMNIEKMIDALFVLKRAGVA